MPASRSRDLQSRIQEKQVSVRREELWWSADWSLDITNKNESLVKTGVWTAVVAGGLVLATPSLRYQTDVR